MYDKKEGTWKGLCNLVTQKLVRYNCSRSIINITCLFNYEYIIHITRFLLLVLTPIKHDIYYANVSPENMNDSTISMIIN